MDYSLLSVNTRRAESIFQPSFFSRVSQQPFSGAFLQPFFLSDASFQAERPRSWRTHGAGVFATEA